MLKLLVRLSLGLMQSIFVAQVSLHVNADQGRHIGDLQSRLHDPSRVRRFYFRYLDLLNQDDIL